MPDAPKHEFRRRGKGCRDQGKMQSERETNVVAMMEP